MVPKAIVVNRQRPSDRMTLIIGKLSNHTAANCIMLSFHNQNSLRKRPIAGPISLHTTANALLPSAKFLLAFASDFEFHAQ